MTFISTVVDGGDGDHDHDHYHGDGGSKRTIADCWLLVAGCWLLVASKVFVRCDDDHGGNPRDAIPQWSKKSDQWMQSLERDWFRSSYPSLCNIVKYQWYTRCTSPILGTDTNPMYHRDRRYEREPREIVFSNDTF